MQVGSPRQAIAVSWLARIHLPALSRESADRCSQTASVRRGSTEEMTMSEKTQLMQWDEWYRQLQSLADLHGENVADADAWREPYDDGQTPEAAFFDEYPEHEE